MKLSYSGTTDIGLEREVNQDSFGTANLEWGDIFVVSDGFGHKEGGKLASQSAVDMFIEKFSMGKPKDIKNFLENSFEEINKYIYYKKVSEYDNAMLGCTAIVVIIEDNTAHIAHIGDSRAYIVQNDKIQRITKDHSYIQALIDKGELSPEKAMFHSKRHVLVKALGSHIKAMPDYTYRVLASQDKLMLCCDGVWGFVSKLKIEEILNNNDSNHAAKKIINVVKENSGTDNITVQVIDFI